MPLRISIRTALLLISAFGIALATWINPSVRQSRAIAAIRNHECDVIYNHELSSLYDDPGPLQPTLEPDCLEGA